MQTNVCGTVRINRKEMPQELKLLQLEKGEAVVFSTADMAAIKWKDKKDVVLLITMHNLEFAETEKTNRYTGQKIVKPSVVIDYNKNMGGVDVGDRSNVKQISHYHQRNPDTFVDLDSTALPEGAATRRSRPLPLKVT